MKLIINGEEIHEEIIKQEADRLRPQYQQTFANQEAKQQEQTLLQWSRENVIERALINQYALKEGKAVSDEDLEKAAEAFKKEHNITELKGKDQEALKKAIESQLKVEQVLRDLCQSLPAPTDEDIEKFYKDNKKLFTVPEQVRAAHIVKHPGAHQDQAEAMQTMQEVDAKIKSGQNFESLVAQYSDCSDKGGDLGYFARGQMVEEFEDVVFNMPTGKISDVFHTRFGYHIAKVYDRKPATVKPLDEVKDQIAAQLQDEARRDRVDNFVDQLKEKAEIKEV